MSSRDPAEQRAMTLRITARQHEELSLIADVTGVSIVEVVREAIDRHLRRMRHRLEPMGIQGMRRCGVCREVEPDIDNSVCPGKLNLGVGDE